ncbi:rhamnosyltransferase [Kosakonia radicincitans]|uniref:glycosyltransferase family 2 protein n=1 Tax=Kosakonia TaxID=1330547 RepID=UPI00090319C2|nr:MULTISPECIES: glycosyltransferase [Kosakonia]APG18789.1 rhamnosyltransferase [Kosakonia radicincitans]NCF05454.1 glycosyltransferase family 2 protein [Kosakonia sp. MH5]
MNFAVVIPTHNGGDVFKECLESITTQSIQPNIILVIDSSSKDNTVELASRYTDCIKIIPSSEFNHGGTRNMAARLVSDVEFIVFLTQDAILNSSFAFANLLSFFESDNEIAAVCGRQLPHVTANPLARHARWYNYPQTSIIKTANDIPILGIKAAFMSNSFAAYRTADLLDIGGFPLDTILAEDMYVAARFLLDGKKVGYCAEASVRHSHNYSPVEEFKRYFDTGVFHSQEKWIREKLGVLDGEGKKFVISELKYLLKTHPLWIPLSILNTIAKLVGFKLGLRWNQIPKFLLPKLSMYKSYWIKK